eukprot:TRINITY_DN5698_c0_g1_i1.p1 TRINITY_DN5698_c0_g1~~TRINITY_DN5698_c0_g1_i1.p1  ORF type:complete len:180 (-),score=4.15 TRINITY_DN5698_c0_g1_i1:462-1001(-)
MRHHPTLFLSHSSLTHMQNWSPDGTRISCATSCFDMTVKIMQVNHCHRVGSLIGHDKSIFKSKWSPDGKRIASASMDRSIKVWNANNYLLLASLGHIGPVLDCSWSPDNNLIASVSLNLVYIWETENYLQIAAFSSHDQLLCCSWSPLGTCIICGSAEGSIQILECQSFLSPRKINSEK